MLCETSSDNYLNKFILTILFLQGSTFPHVLLQSCMLAEWHSTEVALENLLADALPVGLHVPRQLAALSARVRAKLTFVRLFSRVTSSVNSQVAPVLENLSANLARVVPPVGDPLPPVLRVEEGLDLTLLHDRLDCAR